MDEAKLNDFMGKLVTDMDGVAGRPYASDRLDDNITPSAGSSMPPRPSSARRTRCLRKSVWAWVHKREKHACAQSSMRPAFHGSAVRPRRRST